MVVHTYRVVDDTLADTFVQGTRQLAVVCEVNTWEVVSEKEKADPPQAVQQAEGRRHRSAN